MHDRDSLQGMQLTDSPPAGSSGGVASQIRQCPVATTPEVRLLIPVWGRRYISAFADLTLPSLLAPGNVPALADMTNLEVEILTASSDFDFLRHQPAFQSLSRAVSIRLVSIDDLIIDRLYGVTLTLAYLRGVAGMGERILDTYFVFLNADLILADGSLRSVARRILNGDRVLLACSIRGTAEDIEPRLRTLVDPGTHTLSVPPRQLVQMALEAMHPTQIAKIVNNDLCHSAHVNQFYWQVDADTLVSRHFLMFMLCLRPERVVTEVRSFCDYSFVPEMCPTARTTAMEDSDEFFFLEMQSRASERDFLKPGRAGISEIARGLSRWTTQEHRANSLRHTLIFHSSDLPAETEAARVEADNYVREIHKQLDPHPKSHRDHPYWVGTYRAWQARRVQLHGAHLPGGDDTTERTAITAVSRIALMVRHIIFGRPPNVTVLHPDWLDYRSVRSVLPTDIAEAKQQILYINGGPGLLEPALGAPRGVTVAEVLSGSPLVCESQPGQFSLVVAELTKGGLQHLRDLLGKLQPVVSKGGRVAFFVRMAPGESGDLADELVEHIELIAPRELYRTSVYFAGGSFRKVVRDLLRRCSAAYARYGWKVAPLVGVAVIILTLLAVVANLRQAAVQDAHRAVKQCSALTVIFHA